MKKFIKYFVPISCTLVILIVGAYSILKNKQGTTMNTQNLKYGEIIQFHKNEILQFPDFSISYIGKTSTKNDFDPNLTTHYHFVVTALDNKNKTLSWSSGTAGIAPTNFVVENKLYQLELKYSDKDNKQLTDDKMTISSSENDISKYLFQLVTQLSLLPKYNLETLTKILGFSFIETESSNKYFHVFISDGFSPISQAELRIDKNNPQKKLLILEIDVTAKILYKTIMERYPKAQTNVYPPNHPTHVFYGVSVLEPWGKTTFDFDYNNLLTRIVFDSSD